MVEYIWDQALATHKRLFVLDTWLFDPFAEINILPFGIILAGIIFKGRLLRFVNGCEERRYYPCMREK
jgi:uncharacterized membrane protein